MNGFGGVFLLVVPLYFKCNHIFFCKRLFNNFVFSLSLSFKITFPCDNHAMPTSYLISFLVFWSVDYENEFGNIAFCFFS